MVTATPLQRLLAALGRYISALGDGLADDVSADGKSMGLYRLHIAHAASLLILLDGQHDEAALREWVDAGSTAYGRSYLPDAVGDLAERRFREVVEHLQADFFAH